MVANDTKAHGLRDAVWGAAVGDALGVPYEFCGRGTFECTDMIGYGTHNQPAGTAYGIEAIPQKWRDAMRGADVLEDALF